MYSNLNLYYLNQIGITPWVSRASEPKATTSAQLLVITERLLNLKEQTLLNNIIFFLGLLENDWIHLQIDPSGSKQELMKNLSQFESDDLLSFGVDQEFFTDLKLTKSVVQAAPLNLLLSHAPTKKELLNYLIPLKNQFT